MKRHLILLAVSALCLGLVAAAVEKGANFSGTWYLDKSKSDLGTTMGRRGPSGGGPGMGGGGSRGGGFPGGMGRGGGFPGGGRGGTFPGGGSGRGGSYPGGVPSGGGSRGGTNPGARGPLAALDFTLAIEQTESELRLTRKYESTGGDERSATQVLKLDGSESINPIFEGRGQIKSRANWDKNKLVNLGSQKTSASSGGMEIVVKEEYSLSKDGKTLTIKSSRTTPRGKSSSKLVFTKM